jgi:hypothetical protein
VNYPAQAIITMTVKLLEKMLDQLQSEVDLKNPGLMIFQAQESMTPTPLWVNINHLLIKWDLQIEKNSSVKM